MVTLFFLFMTHFTMQQIHRRQYSVEYMTAQEKLSGQDEQGRNFVPS